MMKKTIISSDALGESYYCYRHTSGLEVALYPMPQFSSVYALFRHAVWFPLTIRCVSLTEQKPKCRRESRTI